MVRTIKTIKVMDIHTQTSIEIDFSRGQDFTPTIVFEGAELESKTFSNKTHQIEELLEYITYNENGGCDVYL
jgi:hypothetical protein